MGLFSLLSVGTRGLQAAELGMDVSGQNISNADVEGYSRKRLNMAADYRPDGTYGQMGFGVDVINIDRLRNAFFDQQIQQQNQQVGYYTAIDEAYQNLESIFTEPTETGLNEYINQFFDSWQNLANNPADPSARTMVKTNGEILTGVFHNLATQINDYKQSRNNEIIQRVNKVNELTKEIFNLNKEIAAVEISSQNANDSRDKRDKLLKELSQIIDIDTIENELGQITVTTGGSIIVSPAYQQDIETTTSTYTAADGSTVTDIGMRFFDSKRTYVPNNGELKGLLDARDVVLPEYQAKLDTLANALVAKINEAHVRGYSLNGVSGIEFFDSTSTGASDISLSAAVLSNVQNIAAASGGQILVAPTQTIALTYGTPGSLGNTNINQNSVIVMAGSATLVENTDYQIDYRTGAIQMLHAGYDGTALTVNYRYTAGNSQGVGSNANAIAIAQLREQLTMDNDKLGNPTASFSEFYASFIGRLGLDRNEATSNLDSRNHLVAQYEAQQDSVAGVSLDEEMAEIIKFQHIYQASARLITTTSEMLDILLNM
jgi:flagellar hook-associated protein 1 FlgK